MLKALNYDENQTQKSMRPLVMDRYVRFHLDRDPGLKRRVMTFYNFYKQDPEHARRNYNESDPAYVRGKEIDKLRHEEFDRQMKAERLEEGK